MTAQARYRNFAAESPTLLPLCFQPWYLDAVTAEGEWDVALAEENGEVKGVWTWFLKRKFGVPYVTMPHFTKWMGPWLIPDATRRLTDEHKLIEALSTQLPRTLKMSVDCHPDFQNWLPLYWAGFRQTTRYTYILDINNLEQVKSGFNRNVNRSIKKSEGLILVSDEGDIKEFYAINRLSFQRQHQEPPFTFAQMQRHIESLQQHDAVRLFFARDEQGRLHSAAALTWDAQRAYYHLSGDDPPLRDSGAGIRLIWEAIQFAHHDLHLNTFDFLGSMIPAVEAVRRNFGARQQPYFRLRSGGSLFA